ncbi:MAG: DNA starvation/stationary phase protection protein [Euryarchaeota archaeon RBG_19FT_COMBO_69_17]|nr:MAG: DNA starvation/stationary phase protection protein [Euryarchaeota archaeon RBG_19FT_COMBO_69_17]
MRTNTGLGDAAGKAVVDILNDVLADEFILYTKTLNYHWNVTGPQFHDLHEFFGKQYGALAEVLDEVAERARAVGGPAVGSASEFVKRARLKEHPGEIPAARAMVGNLLEDHGAVIRTLRKDLETVAKDHGDMGTSDFLTGLMERHEKMAWMLRAFLEGKGL